MNLTEMAIEILQIKNRIDQISESDNGEHNYDLETFEQLWSNTSGGFEGMGGCSMTWERVYVFVPKRRNKNYIVFFGGRFGYKIPKDNEVFKEDLKNMNIAGMSSFKERYLKEEE